MQRILRATSVLVTVVAQSQRNAVVCSEGSVQCSKNILLQCEADFWVPLQLCVHNGDCTTAVCGETINPINSTATKSPFTSVTTYTATPAASLLPFASSPLLGINIEGAAVTCDGEFVAVGATNVLRLDTGQILVSGGRGLFSSAHFISRNTFIVGDALKHTLTTVSQSKKLPTKIGAGPTRTLFPVNPSMIQPNDFTIDKTYTRMYLSGMRYSNVSRAGVDGELWYYNFKTKSLNQVPMRVLESAGIHRTNGIELSPDGKSLYVTSAQNGPPTAAGIFKFDVNSTTGVPENPVLLVDVFAELAELGIEWFGMDLDGMKTDVDGVIYVALNGGGRVFVYNPLTKLKQVIELPSMKNPTNLQFGGLNGTRLVVIGHGCNGDDTRSCADYIDFETPGREITDLKRSGKC